MIDRGSNLICVGALAGAFGVRGEVRLKSHSNPNDIALCSITYRKRDKCFEIVVTGRLKNGLAARLSGIVNKEQADD